MEIRWTLIICHEVPQPVLVLWPQFTSYEPCNPILVPGYILNTFTFCFLRASRLSQSLEQLSVKGLAQGPNNEITAPNLRFEPTTFWSQCLSPQRHTPPTTQDTQGQLWVAVCLCISSFSTACHPWIVLNLPHHSILGENLHARHLSRAICPTLCPLSTISPLLSQAVWCDFL